MCRTNTIELSYEEEEEKEYEREGWMETERERERERERVRARRNMQHQWQGNTPVSCAQRKKKRISADKGNMDASEKYPCAFRMEMTIRPLCT